MPILIALGPARLLPNPPVWNATPAPVFTQGIGGQYIVPASMVSDPNLGDTINITYVGSSIPAGSGITFFPGAPGVAYYSYNGVGSGSVSGARLRATDSTNQSTDSNFYTIVITPAQTGAFVDIGLTSQAGGLLPFVFGQAFKKGDFPGDVVLNVAQGQFSVLNRWSDNSVKFGIAAGRTTFIAGTPLTVRMQGGVPSGTALTLANLQQANPAAMVQILGNGTGNLQTCIADPASYLVEQVVAGPEMSEWLFHQNIDSALHVRFHVRLFADGRVAVLPSVGFGYVNQQTNTLGFRTGRIIVTVGGIERFNSGSDTTKLYHHQRLAIPQSDFHWHWIGGNPQIALQHDMVYLRTTKFVPNFIATSVSSSTLNSSFTQTWAFQQIADLPGNSWGATGDAANNYVGMFPGWDACCVASGGDPRAFKGMLANNYASGVYSFHAPDPNTKQPFRVSDWPSADETGYFSGGSYEQYYPVQYSTVFDTSHGPPLGYLPYLLTGDRWFLEELQYYVGYGYLHHGVGQGQGFNRFVDGLQERDVSLHFMRNMMLACVMTPDATSATNSAPNPRRADYIGYYQIQVYYWDTIQNTNANQKLPMGFNTQNHLNSTYQGEWFRPPAGGYSGGFVQNPWTEAFGAFFMGMGKDLEIDLMIDSAYAPYFTRWLNYLYGVILGFFGGVDSTKWNYRFCGVYRCFTASDTSWPLDAGMPPKPLGTAFATHGDGFASWFAVPNDASLPVPAGGDATSIMNSSDGPNFWDSRVINNWTRMIRFDDPNQQFPYFPIKMCTLAKATDHGVAGANDAWWRISHAENWNTCIATLPNAPKYGVQPTVTVTSPGGADYSQLLALRATVNATTGGFVAIPNTRMDSCFPTSAQLNAISPNIYGNGGPAGAHYGWTSAFLLGDKFGFVGAGGHGAYNGYEPFELTLSGTPHWTHPFMPVAPSYVTGDGSDVRYSNPYPHSKHQYGGMVTANNKVWFFNTNTPPDDGRGAFASSYAPGLAPPQCFKRYYYQEMVGWDATADGYLQQWSYARAWIHPNGYVIAVSKGGTYNSPVAVIIDPVTGEAGVGHPRNNYTVTLPTAGSIYAFSNSGVDGIWADGHVAHDTSKGFLRWFKYDRLPNWATPTGPSGNSYMGCWMHGDGAIRNVARIPVGTQTAVGDQYHFDGSCLQRDYQNDPGEGGIQCRGGKVWGWNAGRKIWRIDPDLPDNPSFPDGEHRITEYSYATGPLPASRNTSSVGEFNGTFGKFQYHPTLDAFICCADWADNTYLYVPPAGT